jgi:hypothetical protein
MSTGAAMAASADGHLPELESSVNYIGDMDEFPVFFSENHDRNNLVLDEHRIRIHDARPIQHGLDLERDGFALVDWPSAVRDFTDAAEVDRVYPAEICALIERLTGADKVIATRGVWRWGERAPECGSRINSRPARFVHIDYSRESFENFARVHLETAGVTDIDGWLAGRFVAWNIWRVITPPPQDVPLAICAAPSVAAQDFLTGEAVIDAPGQPEMRFGSSLIRHNPAHRWYWFSDMHPGEALVFKAFDSDRSRIQGCPHSAFNNPLCPPGVTPRGSIEIRAYAYHTAA